MSILKSNNSPIGLFDSGVGGLTVLKHLKTLLPNESYIYFGDTLHMPYGDKSKEQLLEFSTPIFEFFEKKGCKAVVLACNTTSSNIYTEVKDKYGFKMYSIVHSVSEVLANLPVKKLGIFATKATIMSGAYQNIINGFNSEIQVFGQFCPDWVHIVENNAVYDEKSIKIVKSDLEKMLVNSPDKIVLGCTHYPYLLDVLSKFVQSDMFIDPAIYFSKYIQNDLDNAGLLSGNQNNTEEFYVSSNPLNFKNSAKMFYQLEYMPELVTV